jgi:hypothetical protein
MRATLRSDGWTPDRQLTFLDALARTRSVTAAARAAGMSRESAHRLRNRPGCGLFAALWDLILAPAPTAKSHTAPFGDGQLARLLGTHFRRERGDFAAAGARAAKGAAGDRTGPL